MGCVSSVNPLDLKPSGDRKVSFEANRGGQNGEKGQEQGQQGQEQGQEQGQGQGQGQEESRNQLQYREAADNSANLFAAIKRGDVAAVRVMVDAHIAEIAAQAESEAAGAGAETGTGTDSGIAGTAGAGAGTGAGAVGAAGAGAGRGINSLLGMWGSTPLIVAAQYQQTCIMKIILAGELGNIDHRNEKGASAMLYAAMEGQTDMVRIMRDLGASVGGTTTQQVYNQATDK
ncbi:hypothetical protein B484DRAFT_471796, partial [Ochromonadaceae sp. CCMP2298]